VAQYSDRFWLTVAPEIVVNGDRIDPLKFTDLEFKQFIFWRLGLAEKTNYTTTELGDTIETVLRKLGLANKAGLPTTIRPDNPRNAAESKLHRYQQMLHTLQLIDAL